MTTTHFIQIIVFKDEVNITQKCGLLDFIWSFFRNKSTICESIVVFIGILVYYSSGISLNRDEGTLPGEHNGLVRHIQI